ncbi:MAG: hypothetical protein V3V05_07685 [Pontiella sp.]
MIRKMEADELPKWPHLDVPHNNELRVHGKHITYNRLILAERVSSLLGLALAAWIIYAFFFSDYEIIRSRSFDNLVFPFLGTCMGGTIAILMLPKPLARFVFPRKTSIRFTPDVIYVGWKKYKLFPDSNIEFRAYRPHLPDEKLVEIQGKMQMRQYVSEGAYKLKFRKIEMVYGSRLIHITSVADQDRAEQFAIMLQAAYMRTRPGIVEKKPTPSPEIKIEEFEDMLPE